MIKVRNVWGIDTWKGPYCDDKIKNDDALLKELGHSVDKKDGIFWMSGEDFVKYFNQITIGYQIDNYKNNYKVVRGVQSWKYHLYQFDLKEGAHAWVGISFYNPRFYVKDCRVGQTAGYMIIKKGSKIIFRGGIYDIYPLNFKEIEDAEEGTYQLYVKVAWADGDKPDYSVRVVTN